MNERTFTIICCVITFFLSLLSSWLIKKYEYNKVRKENKYKEFYKKFYILWDSIHKGKALEFSDLKSNDRNKIVDFFMNNYNYISEELEEMIYELKTRNSTKIDKDDIKICNKCYNLITDFMITKELKYRKKYNKINY